MQEACLPKHTCSHAGTCLTRFWGTANLVSHASVAAILVEARFTSLHRCAALQPAYCCRTSDSMRPWPAEAGSLDRQSKMVLAPNSLDSLYGQSLQNSGTPANGQLLSPAQGKRSQQNGRTNGARVRPSGVRRAVVRQLLWVPRILCEMAQLPRLWWPQVRCCTVLGCEMCVKLGGR